MDASIYPSICSSNPFIHLLIHLFFSSFAHSCSLFSVGLIKDIVPLSDPAGPTKTDPDIQCLVVSCETLEGGKAVNNSRKYAGLPEMDLFSIDLVSDEEEDG